MEKGPQSPKRPSDYQYTTQHGCKAADIELISMDGVYSEIYMAGENPTNPKLMRKSLGEWEKLLPRICS